MLMAVPDNKLVVPIVSRLLCYTYIYIYTYTHAHVNDDTVARDAEERRADRARGCEFGETGERRVGERNG